MAFAARFASRCAECGGRIEVDELIEGCEGGYCHAECPEAVPEKPTRFQGTTLEEMGF